MNDTADGCRTRATPVDFCRATRYGAGATNALRQMACSLPVLAILGARKASPHRPAIGISWWDTRIGRGTMVRKPKPGCILDLLAASLVVAVQARTVSAEIEHFSRNAVDW